MIWGATWVDTETLEIFYRPDLKAARGTGKIRKYKTKEEVISLITAPHETDLYTTCTIDHHYESFSEQLWMVNEYKYEMNAHLWQQYGLSKAGDSGRIICGMWVSQRWGGAEKLWDYPTSYLYHELGGMLGISPSCPLRFLSMAPERNAEWRAKVREWNAKRREYREEVARWEYERTMRNIALEYLESD